MKEKDLCGIPWRLAFALQQDGWYLRSEIIWAKPNPMPESVTDRPTKAHEQVFLLTRSPRYFYDADAVREPDAGITGGRQRAAARGDDRYVGTARRDESRKDGVSRSLDMGIANGRNLRSVWEIPTEPYPDAHFATFPQALVERCVKAGTSERGCCPVCGAPWERETETDRVIRSGAGPSPAHTAVKGYSKRSAFVTNALPHTRTLGWRPTCDCFSGRSAGNEWVAAGAVTRPTGPIPCTVFDPFIGSGTTASVARRLGRKCVGIELNPDSCRQALNRTRQLSLLAEGTA
jgi:hypothetical protein